MSDNSIAEARRQLEICNACRYCENFCSVFPAVHRRREFSAGSIALLANLCHDCRGCYYACQYVEPHEFAINIPALLAQLRNSSWQEHALPTGFARAFQRSGAMIALATVIALALIIGCIGLFTPARGAGFYGILSHDTMLALFIPAFVVPLVLIGASLRRFWRNIGGGAVRVVDIRAALAAAASMKNLDGGHGEGCNFEDEDRFSNRRRWYHQATMYGFLLCFAATCVATLMHYGFDSPAPYPFWSLPKLLGVSGGLSLCIGCAGLALLKIKADPRLGSVETRGGEMGFILLLFLVSVSGLLLYWLADSEWLAALVALHLGSVLAFFLLMPYSKMLHGFYRLAALTRDACDQQARD